MEENGLDRSQIKPDKSRETLLINNWLCGEVAPWGYRNEINYKTPKGLVDVATIEKLPFIPRRDLNGEIASVEPWKKSFVISGTGLERLCMLSEGLEKIQDVENIKPLYENCLNYENPLKVSESLRLLHRIVADSGGDLSDKRSSGKNRKRKYNLLLRNLYQLDRLHISYLLDVNAQINPWYPELNYSKEIVLSELERYSIRQTRIIKYFS